MANASFVQTDFTGGEISPDAQGRFHDPKYKTALNVCLNGYPTEEGAWTRRPGFRYLAHTRHGNPAVLRSFDFSITQPYQMEFTDSFLRFFAGLALVPTLDAPYVAAIGTDTPATVVCSGELPADWIDGNTVQFTLNSVPCSAPLLCGRQFTIQNRDTTAGTFTLHDPITGADIDGSGIAYAFPTTPDQVRKVFALATPYTLDDLSGIRTVQDQANILLLHDGYQQRLITEGVSPAPFAIAVQDLSDGPYLDVPKDNAVTLTPSGTTGSITVSASGLTGINGGLGFQSTDVGRLIRFMSAPAAWSGATSYDKAAIVLGSDDNIYNSLVGANLNNDPTTDDATNWQITDTVVTWTWLKITAVGSTTSVTATVMGVDLPDTTGSLTWQLGLYSDTTGWPTAGSYHDGRLWLTASAFPNRVDASQSNDYFNFAPTETDGTTTDDSAVAAVFNANDVNAIRWMLSTEDGLMAGTQAGVRRVKASVLDDPISDFNIQERRVENYGCADVEPVQPAGQTVYVQRQSRKILGHIQTTESQYRADNISHLADHLTGPGIAEIRWQQEPSLNLWARLNDNSLIGCVYKRVMSYFEQERFAGFHRLTHGGSREFESIAAGPSFDGLSDTLYAVTNQTDADEPDHNVRWVECLMPQFDAGQAECDAFHVDGGAVPCCAILLATDSIFTGLRIYGLWHLNGKTIQPFIGGLDLGDYTVANGSIDITFGDASKGHDAALFTLAFFSGLSSCDLFGADGYGTTSAIVTPPYVGSLMGVVGSDSPVQYSGFGGSVYVDHTNTKLYFLELSPASGIKVIDGAVPGDELAQATESDIFGAGPAYSFSSTSGRCFHPSGKFFANVGDANSEPIAKIDLATLTMDEVVGSATSSLSASTCDPTTGVLTRMPGSFQMIALQRSSGGATTDYVVSRNIRGVGSEPEVAVLNTTTTGSMGLLYAVNVTENVAGLCAGRTGGYPVASFFALGRVSNYGFGVATPSVLYEYHVSADAVDPAQVYDNNEAVSRRIVRASIVPPDIDATWTNFTAVSDPGFDKLDGNVIAFFTTDDAVTNKNYLVKFDAVSGGILWTLAVSGTPSLDLPQCNVHGSIAWLHSSTVIAVDLSDGSQTSTAWSSSLALQGTQVFDYLTASIVFNGTYGTGGTPVPTYIGDYLPANGDEIPNFRWGRIYTGAPYTTQTTTSFPFYGSIGFTYTSDGQLLEPDTGPDAGAQNGPAFAKTRRLHKAAFKFYRTRGVSIGTDFAKLRSVPLKSAGGTNIASPNLYSDTWRSDDGLEGGYSFKGRIAWRIERPYPCTITAIGGFVESADI